MSTELAATLLLDDIRKNIDKKLLVGAVFVDLSKAFDTIIHSKLLTYSFKRSAQVNCNDVISEPQQLKSGVPQGSILGPLFFVFYFNDITDVIEANIVKYADDTVIYWADKDVTNLKKILNKEMKKLDKWMDVNELIPNLKKRKTGVGFWDCPASKATEYRDMRTIQRDKNKYYLFVQIFGSGFRLNVKSKN